MKNRTMIHAIIRVTVVILMIVVLCLFFYHPDRSQDGISEYVFLADSYDSKERSFSEFLASEDSYEILQKTYSQISESSTIPYLEFADQSVEYVGKLNISKEFAPSGMTDQNNQKDGSGKFFSTLKSMQLSSNAMDTFGMEVPDNVEWKGSGRMPVLLGDAYQKYFQKGDEVILRYLGEKEFRCIICGFLEKGKSICIDDEEYVFDTYIVMPSVEVENTDDLEYSKILLSVKCEGVLCFRDLEEKDSALWALKALSDETGFQCTLRGECHELFD